MMFKRIVGTLVILMLVGVVVAQENITKPEPTEEEPKKDCPSEEACVLWEEFKEKYGPNWTVKWHGDRNIPRRISGKHDLGRVIKDKDDAEAVAKEIITDSKDLLGIDDIADLKLKRVYEDKFGFIIEYEQLYKGIPVYRGEVRITLGKNIFEGIGNNFYPDINISTTPKITREEAVRIAEDEVKGYRKVESVELYILPQKIDGKLEYRLTWRTYFKGAFFFIDAEDGDIVHREYTVVATPAPVGGDDGVVNNLGFSWLGVIALLLLLLIFVLWRWRK